MIKANKSFYLEELEHSLRTDEESDFIHSFTDRPNISRKRNYLAERLRGLSQSTKSDLDWPFKYPLYDHQKEAVRASYNYFSNPDKPPRAFTVIPTGGGKTEIFAHVVNSLAQPFQIGAQHVSHRITPPTIILVPTVELVGQTIERFQKNFPDLQIGQYYGEKKEIRPTTVMVYNSFIDAVDNKLINPNDVSVLVMDEAHRGLSDFRQDIFEKFKNKTVTLAYTATPAFGDDKNIEQLFGSDTQAYSTTISRLIKDGRLAPVDNYIVHVDIRFEEGAKPEKNKDLLKIIRVAKMRAALEFLLTHEDPETGEMLAGRTTIGFNRYVNAQKDQSSASGTAAYFEREIRKRMEEDPILAERLSEFDNIAEYVGGNQKGSDKVIERVKNGETMAMFNVKYAREGTDIPRIYNVLNMQGSNSLVDTLQGNGRALRTVKEDPYKRASIVDFHVTLNGKRLDEKRPLFFYEAVQDESIVKDVFTQPVHIDAATAQEMLSEADELESGHVKPKTIGKTTTTTIGVRNRFRDRGEFRDLVIGTGTAAEKYGQAFDELYDRLEAHVLDQQGNEDPVPFFVDGREIKTRVKQGQVQAHSYAYQPFRSAINFPRQKTAAFVDETEVHSHLLKEGSVATEYTPVLDTLLDSIKGHYQDNQDLVDIPPFLLGNVQKTIPTVETVNPGGDLIMAIPKWAKRSLLMELGVPRDKTPRWKDREQFDQLILGDVEEPAKFRPEVNRLWDDMQRHCDHQIKSGTQDNYQLGDHQIHVDYCMDSKGDKVFCVGQEAATPVRKHLSISNDDWKLSKQNLLDRFTYTATLDDVHNVTIKKPAKPVVYTAPPAGWVTRQEIKGMGDYRIMLDSLSHYSYLKRTELKNAGSNGEAAQDYITEHIVGRFRTPGSKKIEWYLNPKYLDDAIYREAMHIKLPRCGWINSYDMNTLNPVYWDKFLSTYKGEGNHREESLLYFEEMKRLQAAGMSAAEAHKKLREDGVVTKFWRGKKPLTYFGLKTIGDMANWLKENPDYRNGLVPAKDDDISEYEIIRDYETPRSTWTGNEDTALLFGLAELRRQKSVRDRDTVYDEVRAEFPKAFGGNWVGRHYSPAAVSEMEEAGVIKKNEQETTVSRLEQFKQSRPDARSIDPNSGDINEREGRNRGT